MSKSSALEREIKGYLPPKYHNLFSAYVALNEMGKSEAMNVITREFFDKMPEADRQRLLSFRQSKNSY